MNASATPTKIDGTIKDFLVTYGLATEYPYHLGVRIFVGRCVAGDLERSVSYFKRENIAVAQGQVDSELREVLRSWWRRRRLLTKHVPFSHLPIENGSAYWFNASLSLAQVAALSLQSWVQEIRTVSIPIELVMIDIPVLVDGVITKTLARLNI